LQQKKHFHHPFTMLDYIKIRDLGKKDSNRTRLDFQMRVIEGTGELPHENKTVKFKGMTFTLTPCGRYMSVFGSIHKFANDGGKNNDRFSFERFLQIAEELQEYISLEDRINVIEFGLNIKTPFKPNEYLKSLIAHKKLGFNQIRRQGERWAEATYNQYKVKIYDKGRQQGGGNILRFEVHVYKMQWLRKSFPYGLIWADLLRPETWVILSQYLIKAFSGIIHYDPSLEEALLSSKEKKIIEQGNNPFFWVGLNGEHQERVQNRFQSIVMKYGTKFNVLSDLFKDELQRVLPQNMAEIYYKSDSGLDTKPVNQSQKMAEIYHLVEKENNTPNPSRRKKLADTYPLLDSKEFIHPSQKRICIVTGLDISMQKPTSRFLNRNGLKNIYENDPELYNQLLSELPPRWKHKPLDLQFDKIAHHIRDRFFNKRNYTKRAIEKLCDQPALFNNSALISEEKKTIAYRP